MRDATVTEIVEQESTEIQENNVLQILERINALHQQMLDQILEFQETLDAVLGEK